VRDRILRDYTGLVKSRPPCPDVLGVRKVDWEFHRFELNEEGQRLRDKETSTSEATSRTLAFPAQSRKILRNPSIINIQL